MGAPGYGPSPSAPYGFPQGQSGATAQYPQATPPAKKPFHKRPWVLVVAGLLVIGSISNAVDGDEEEPAASSAAAPSTSTTAPSTAAPSTPSQAIAPPVATTPTTSPTTSAAPAVDFVMPDFVGMDLQTAQNLVQSNGVFLSKSHDLLGNRSQVLDSNWIVCDQNLPAGQRVTGDVEGVIDFGAVKREEPCP